MKVSVDPARRYEPAVGNVYPVLGGRGLREGNLQILFCITEDDPRGPKALMLTVNSRGSPIGVTYYGLHYLKDKTPIAFASGFENLEIKIGPLP